MTRVELIPGAGPHAYYYAKSRQSSASDHPPAPGEARTAAFAALSLADFIFPRRRQSLEQVNADRSLSAAGVGR